MSADEDIQPMGQNTHSKRHKAEVSHDVVKQRRCEDGAGESPAGGRNAAVLGNAGREIGLDPATGPVQPWGRWMRVPSGGAAAASGLRPLLSSGSGNRKKDAFA